MLKLAYMLVIAFVWAQNADSSESPGREARLEPTALKRSGRHRLLDPSSKGKSSTKMESSAKRKSFSKGKLSSTKNRASNTMESSSKGQKSNKQSSKGMKSQVGSKPKSLKQSYKSMKSEARDPLVEEGLTLPTEEFVGNEDWQRGTSINLAVTDTLQLNDKAAPLNFIWVPLSNLDRIQKINTVTGEIIGDYRSGPSSAGSGNPSRTTVDADGSLWVANRNHNPGTVLHIGLVENGQCEDRNGNGVIDTSTMSGDVLEWLDESGNRSVATAEDECMIIASTRVNSVGTRHLSFDADNNLWVGGLDTRKWDLVKGGTYSDPDHGQILRRFDSVGFGGYGGVIDPNGVLWSAGRFDLLRWDVSLPLEGPNGDPPGNDIGPPIDGRNWAGSSSPPAYGICIDSMGNVWATSLRSDQIAKYSPSGEFVDFFYHGTPNPSPQNGWRAQGCTVGPDDDVWVSHSISGDTVGHLLNNGTFVGIVEVDSGPTGVSVDSEGKIWSTNYGQSTLSRIDPAGNNGVGAVDLVVELPSGAFPYSYGDMTGSTNTAPPKVGSWTFLYDSAVEGQEWGILTWDADVPSDAQVIVEARSSVDGTVYSAYETVEAGVNLRSLPNGRYLEVRVRLIRASTGESPIVRQLALFAVPTTIAPSSEPTPSQTPNPTPVPTPMPTIQGTQPNNPLSTFLVSNSFDNGAALNTPGSPQSRAVDECLDDGILAGYTNDRILQSSECTWNGITCDNTVVSQVSLDNIGMTGSLPLEIGFLSSVTFFSVRNANRPETSIGGVIPSSIGFMASLIDLRLQDNMIGGPVPSEIGMLQNANVITCNMNRLTSIPTEAGLLTALSVFNFANNSIGSIPSEIGNMAALATMNWSENPNLTGNIPSDLGKLSNLGDFRVNDCNLQGPVPTELAGWVSMRRLEIDGNALTGDLPSAVCDTLTSPPIVASPIIADCNVPGGISCTCCTSCCDESGTCS